MSFMLFVDDPSVVSDFDPTTTGGSLSHPMHFDKGNL